MRIPKGDASGISVLGAQVAPSVSEKAALKMPLKGE